MTASAGTFRFTGELWLYEGDAAWYFIDLPEELSDQIDAEYGHIARGFGSQKVEVTIGTTTWSTSIFPSKARETFMLPVKKAVRTAQGLTGGSKAKVELRIIT